MQLHKDKLLFKLFQNNYDPFTAVLRSLTTVYSSRIMKESVALIKNNEEVCVCVCSFWVFMNVCESVWACVCV